MSINNDALKSVPRNVNVSRRVVSKRNKLIGPLPLGWRRKKEGHVVYWIGTRQPPFLGQITPPFDFIQRTQNWKSFSNESVRKEKAKEAPLFDRYHVVFGGEKVETELCTTTWWKKNFRPIYGARTSNKKRRETDSAVIFTCVLRLGWNSSGVKHPHLCSQVNPWNMEEKVGQAGIL